MASAAGPISTTDASATEVIAAGATPTKDRHLAIHETSGNTAQFTFDGGTTWRFLPASSSLIMDDVDINNQAIQVRRITATDVTVWANTW